MGEGDFRSFTETCALLLATGLFIDSHSLVGGRTYLDLPMMETRISPGLSLGGDGDGRRPFARVCAGKTSDHFLFFYP
jgi:hypothetical protein